VGDTKSPQSVEARIESATALCRALAAFADWLDELRKAIIHGGEVVVTWVARGLGASDTTAEKIGKLLSRVSPALSSRGRLRRSAAWPQPAGWQVWRSAWLLIVRNASASSR
jgi:hypothetical protein